MMGAEERVICHLKGYNNNRDGDLSNHLKKKNDINTNLISIQIFLSFVIL